jgi:glycosyltransferase involved in cell wall biosynthesis
VTSLLVNLSFVIPKPTGISTYATNLFSHLQSLNPTLLISQNIDNYRCYPVPSNLTPDHGTKGHFQRLIWSQIKVPQIYRGLKSSLLFSPIPEAPLFTDCRSVVMIHDLIPLRFPRRFSLLTPYFRYYIPQVLTQAQHIICNSDATAKDITDFFNIPSKKITPTLLAYDDNHFRLLNLDASTYFLYIGRHDPHKNLERLIEAFANLPNCHSYELWLVGSTDKRYTPSLIRQATNLGVHNQVKFIDYVSYDDLPKIISGAIALVFPSLWEGFGLPVLEAMACGTPVITSNLSSLPEVAGDAGILIDPYKVDEITDAMQAIANQSGLRSHLSQLGLERASLFSWEKTGKETVEVLKRFL